MINPPTDPWNVSEADFPESGDINKKLIFLLNYAVLAPSGHNTQPWLFKVRDGFARLYADRTRALAVVDPNDRELVISCGAALMNLRVAVMRFGYRCNFITLPDPEDPDFIACVTMGKREEPTDEVTSLFRSILMRRTNRMPFEERSVPGSLLERLKEAAGKEGAWLHVVEDKDEKIAVAELVAEGDRLQARDKLFRRELAAWVHPNRSRSRDGIPGYAIGIGDVASYAGPILIRTFDWGRGQAARDRQLAEGSPALVVLGTDTEGDRAWIDTGQALERLLLRARAEGVWASYLNQPIEVDHLRTALIDILKREGSPQLILRLGYGPDVKPTPRRPVDEVLI